MTRRLSLCAALAALALSAAPAIALGAANHPFLAAINGGYEDACGVALQGGGLYVSDYYHDQVDLPSGTIEAESPADGPCKLVFDSAGDLYVNNWHQDVVRYESGDFRAGAGTVIDAAQPTGLAVDKASGDVYVAHRTYVSEYSSTGALITAEIGLGGLGGLGEAYGLAVSEYPATAGYLYVPDAASHTVKVFNPATSLTVPVEEWSGEATPQGAFTYLVNSEVAVDNSPTSPSYGHVFVLDAIGHGKSEHPEAALDEFNAAGDYRGQIAGLSDAEPSGVAIEETTGPNDGDLYVTSGNTESSAVFKYGPTAPAKTLTVAKAGTGGGTVRSSPAGITCGSACAAEFNEGEKAELLAAPDAHSVFKGWSGGGCAGAGSCSVIMSAAAEVHADFEEPTQETLTMSASDEGTVSSEPVGISCPGNCAEHFSQGRLVTLTATPAPHSRLLGWSGCTARANPDECELTMSAPAAVEAHFAPIPQLTLSVAVGGAGQGTVTSFPAGISCPGGACSGQFDEGSSVYLAAAPAPGSSFAGFSGGCTGSAPICEVAMGQAQSVGAEFTSPAQGPSLAQAALSPAPTMTLGRASVQGPTATLALSVSGAGTVLAAGQGVEPLKAHACRAGKLTLHLALTAAGRRALQRRHRLRTRVELAFAPAGGAQATAASSALTFGTTTWPHTKAEHRSRR